MLHLGSIKVQPINRYHCEHPMKALHRVLHLQRRVSNIIKQWWRHRGRGGKVKWSKPRWNMLILLHSLLVMERRMKLCVERKWFWMPPGRYIQPNRTAHVSGRWIKQNSLVFPRLWLQGCIIYSLVLPIVLAWLIQLHIHSRVSCRPYHSEGPGPGHTSAHLWQRSPPNAHFMKLTGPRSFTGFICLVKKQKWYRTKTPTGGLTFICELSKGYTCSGSRAFQHHSI